MLLFIILYIIFFIFCAIVYLIERYILKIKRVVALVIAISLFLMLSGYITYFLLTVKDL